MRVLLDECVDVRLSDELPNHEVRSVVQEGWRGKKNGELLRLAAAHFDVFVTTDQNLRYQQNLQERRLAIVVLPTTRWPEIKPHAGKIRETLYRVSPGSYMEVVW